MSTPESNRRAASRLHTAIDRGLLALGGFIAVAVMVFFWPCSAQTAPTRQVQ